MKLIISDCELFCSIIYTMMGIIIKFTSVPTIKSTFFQIIETLSYGKECPRSLSEAVPWILCVLCRIPIITKQAPRCKRMTNGNLQSNIQS